MAKCDPWCLPVIIYIVVAIMSLISIVRLHFQDPKLVSTEAVVMSVLYKTFWLFILYILCQNCHEGIAWFILLIPIIFILLLLFLLFGAFGGYLANANNKR